MYSQIEGVKNIEVVMPLFQEQLLLYHKKSESDESMAGLIRQIEQKEIDTIGFTSDESYSYRLFQNIAQLLRIPMDDVVFKFENYRKLISDFDEGKVDVLVTFSLELEELEAEGTGSFYFTEEEVDLITSRIMHTSKVEVAPGHYTIGTYTFLVGLSDKISEFENEYNVRLSELIIESFEKDTSFIGSKINTTIDSFSQPSHHRFLDGLPLTPSLKGKANMRSGMGFFRIAGFLILAIALVLFFLRRKIPELKMLRTYWLRHNHVVIGVLLLVGLYIFCIQVMIWAEQDLYDKIQIKSPILNMSGGDLHLWVFVSNMVGDSNGIIPFSTLGKLMFSVSFYTTWLGGFCIIVVGYLKALAYKKRKKGMKKLDIKNHVVLSGWNSSSKDFVINYFESSESPKQDKIVVIISNPEVILNEHPEISHYHSTRKLEFIKGDAREEGALGASNVQDAKTVVLFAENSDESSDEKTLLRALSISRYCRSKSLEMNAASESRGKFKRYSVNQYIDAIYIIAEINHEKYKSDLLAADVNEVICTSHYSRNIVTQSIRNHGLSRLLDQLLTYDSSNEFYTIPLKDEQNKLFVHKTYDELNLLLRKVYVQLVGIKVVYHDDQNRQIIDDTEISRLLREDGLDHDLIVNPISEGEVKRPVDHDDVLIVLCESEKELRQRISELRKMAS